MTYTEKRLEQLVKEVTDYGFNDEYGYYNDWADGVRPILEKAIAQALAEERGRVVEWATERRNKCVKLKTSEFISESEDYFIGKIAIIDDILASLDKPLTGKE